MKFVFPFAQYTGDKLGIEYVTLNIPDKMYNGRRIRRLISKVVKQKYGHVLTKQEAEVLFAAGKQITGGLGAAIENAENNNVVMEEAEFANAVAQLQKAAEERARTIEG